jgi:hypothetical protein
LEKYHRVLNRRQWDPLLLGKLLLGLIIQVCVPAGAPIGPSSGPTVAQLA